MTELKYSKKQIAPLMEKYSIAPDNGIFESIIKMFNEQTNYQVWAIKAVFSGVATIEDIKTIKTWADSHQSQIKKLIKNNIVAYNKRNEFAKLFSEMNGLDMICAVNNTIDKFNTSQRNMLRTAIAECNVTDGENASNNKSFRWWYDTLKQFEGIAESRKKLFITKASAYTSLNALKKGIEDALLESYDWCKEDLLSYVERNTPDCKVVYNKGDIVILQVTSFDSSHKLCGGGRTGWCITREESYFKQYVTSKVGHRQYFYFDFSKKDNDELAHIGFTVNDKNGIVNAHSTRNNSLLGDGIAYKGRRVSINSVLKDNNINSSIYLSLPQLNHFGWNLESLFEYLNKCKNSYNVVFNKDGRIIIECKNRQAVGRLCAHTLIGTTNSYDSSIHYVMIDMSLEPKNEYSTICAEFTKDRYGSLSLRNVYDAYNNQIKDENYFDKIGINIRGMIEDKSIPSNVLLHKYIHEDREGDACALIKNEGESIDVNYEFEGDTPIFLAMHKGMFGLFKMIISHPGFNKNTCDVFGEKILSSLLYEYIGRLEYENAESAENIKKMIDIILADSNFDFNAMNVNDDTAINIACQSPSLLWVAEALLAKPSVDINVVDDFNLSALGNAIYGGNVEAIKLLAKHPNFVVRDADREIAATKGISLHTILETVRVACN